MLSLALLRHAKSSWEGTGIDDFDRPLNERGRAAAPLMGEVLKELNFVPQLVLCSPAQRTRETLVLMEPSLNCAATGVTYDDQLYLTSPRVLCDRLKSIPFDTKTVLMVGHNPGLHGLAMLLAGTGDAKSISRLEDKFPTAALAVLTFPQSAWRDLAPAAGHLEAFITPRDRA